MESVDTVVRNGRVIDPAHNTDAVLDVAMKDGKIHSVGPNLSVDAAETFDATGCIVTPGLIDAHVHCYEYATPLGVNADADCLSRGVTTVVDAGSAGACTFLGLKKFIIEKSKTRVLACLHIAKHGLAASGCAGGAAGGESDTLYALDEEECLKCIQDNRDTIVGVKVRLQSSVCANGRTEEEAFRRAMSVARRCGLPLMVHHCVSTIPTQRATDPTAKLACPGDLIKGDIYTHSFTGFASSIVDLESREIWSDVIDARSRGVLFDVGHGRGSCNWTVCEIAAKAKFWPDLIGSDLHTQNQRGPVYDLPNVMTKFLHLGMPMPDLIRGVTIAPAEAYGISHVAGSLRQGIAADVTVTRIDDCDVLLEDSHGQVRNVKRRFVPVFVWRNGARFPVMLPSPWPNNAERLELLPIWSDKESVKDADPPPMS